MACHSLPTFEYLFTETQMIVLPFTSLLRHKDDFIWPLYTQHSARYVAIKLPHRCVYKQQYMNEDFQLPELPNTRRFCVHMKLSSRDVFFLIFIQRAGGMEMNFYSFAYLSEDKYSMHIFYSNFSPLFTFLLRNALAGSFFIFFSFV